MDNSPRTLLPLYTCTLFTSRSLDVSCIWENPLGIACSQLNLTSIFSKQIPPCSRMSHYLLGRCFTRHYQIVLINSQHSREPHLTWLYSYRDKKERTSLAIVQHTCFPYAQAATLMLISSSFIHNQPIPCHCLPTCEHNVQRETGIVLEFGSINFTPTHADRVWSATLHAKHHQVCCSDIPHSALRIMYKFLSA